MSCHSAMVGGGERSAEGSSEIKYEVFEMISGESGK